MKEYLITIRVSTPDNALEVEFAVIWFKAIREAIRNMNPTPHIRPRIEMELLEEKIVTTPITKSMFRVATGDEHDSD